jgi:hypothetical protein
VQRAAVQHQVAAVVVAVAEHPRFARQLVGHCAHSGRGPSARRPTAPPRYASRKWRVSSAPRSASRRRTLRRKGDTGRTRVRRRGAAAARSSRPPHGPTRRALPEAPRRREPATSGRPDPGGDDTEGIGMPGDGRNGQRHLPEKRGDVREAAK